MPFLTGVGVVVRRLDDERWVLVDPIIYQGNEDTWAIPVGFVTDFASVPRVAVWLIPRFGRFTPAAILHDWLVNDGIRGGLISPVDADGVFRRVMRELGVPPVRRWLAWAGVRWSATTQAHRRPGWWSTAPVLFGITLVAIPLVVPPGLAILIGLGLYGLAEAVATRGRRSGDLST
jgi:hypothetical protein